MQSSNKPSENKEKEIHQNSNNNLFMTNDDANNQSDFTLWIPPALPDDAFLNPFTGSEFTFEPNEIEELFPELLETNTLALEEVSPENELPLQVNPKKVNLQTEGNIHYTATKRFRFGVRSFNAQTTMTLNTWNSIIPDSNAFNNLINDGTLQKNEDYKKTSVIFKEFQHLSEDEGRDKSIHKREMKLKNEKQFRKLDPEKVKDGHPLYTYLNKPTTVENWKKRARKTLKNGEKIKDLYLPRSENDNIDNITINVKNLKKIDFKSEGSTYYTLTTTITVGGQSFNPHTTKVLSTWNSLMKRTTINDYIKDGTLLRNEYYQKQSKSWNESQALSADEQLVKINQKREQNKRRQEEKKLDPTKIDTNHPLYKYLAKKGGVASLSAWRERARRNQVKKIKTLLLDVYPSDTNSKEIGNNSIAQNDETTPIESVITNLDTISSINPSDDQMSKSSTEQLLEVSANSRSNPSKKRTYDESNETDTNIQNLSFPVYISERSSAPTLFNARPLDQQFSHPLTEEQFNFLSLQQPHSSSLQAHSILNTQKKNKTQQNPPDPSSKPFDGPTSS